jgi:hypothetical protein
MVLFLDYSRHKSLPKFSASTREASLPLGSIRPVRRS